MDSFHVNITPLTTRNERLLSVLHRLSKNFRSTEQNEVRFFLYDDILPSTISEFIGLEGYNFHNIVYLAFNIQYYNDESRWSEYGHGYKCYVRVMYRNLVQVRGEIMIEQIARLIETNYLTLVTILRVCVDIELRDMAAPEPRHYRFYNARAARIKLEQNLDWEHELYRHEQRRNAVLIDPKARAEWHRDLLILVNFNLPLKLVLHIHTLNYDQVKQTSKK